MRTSPAGRKALKGREGERLNAYQDSVGVWTIGVGHTSAAGLPKVTPTLKITRAEQDEILSRDLVMFEDAVNAAVKVALTQNQFDALVSLAFNIGIGAFRRSTVVRHLKAGDYEAAAEAFLLWNKPPEIMGRRRSERKQFLSGGVAKGKQQLVAAPLTPIKPKPTPVPTPADEKELTRRVQTGLKLLNYNPGGVDGELGTLTKGAIRIFRADSKLPDGDFIDDALLKALTKAEPREMVAARANATPSQIAKIVPEAGAHWWNKWLAGGGLGGGTLLAVGDAIAPAKGYVDQLSDDIPRWAWLLLFAIFCSGIAYMAIRGQKSSDEAYRTGDRR